jgi:RHS repeat-associated protein
VYGVTVTGGSDIYSNDLLSAIQYPDKTTGNPSSSSQESFTVNALGDTKTYSDRNGNLHTYSFDVLGRLTTDAITTLGTGVDGTIRRIEVAYDTGDRPYLFTSYNAASGGSIMNQVQDAYNGLGQLITEYQAHSGAVNTVTSPNVQYSYTLMSGGVNNSRLTGMTYPSGGRSITYNYASGLDDTISRLTSITDGGTTLESLSYLGLNTVVKRAHPQPGVDLTYIKQTGESTGDAGDQYTGLDRFGRVVDQRWILTSNGTALDRFQYGYDRNSNVLYKNNLVNSSFSELYHANGAGNGYDQLNQLTNFARGTLNGGNDTISSPTHSISWSLDALGNWTSTLTDGTTTQNRTANQQNEITSISSQTTPTYDANGNMTGDETGHTLIFDAWNRLVQVKNGSTVLETYTYDTLGRRVTENPGTLRDLYYDRAWQLLEEDVAGSMADQYVWSPVYIDALIERDTPTQRMYVLQDANFNVTALVDTSGTVQERYIQDPYGSFTVLAANWTTRGTSNYGWVFYFQGKRYDFATGLFASRERDYSPTLGRWIENDPLGFGGGDTNLYRAEGNNATSNVDPIGLETIQEYLRTKNTDISDITVPGPVNDAERGHPNKPVTITSNDGILTLYPDGSMTFEKPDGTVIEFPPPPKPWWQQDPGYVPPPQPWTVHPAPPPGIPNPGVYYNGLPWGVALFGPDGLFYPVFPGPAGVRPFGPRLPPKGPRPAQPTRPVPELVDPPIPPRLKPTLDRIEQGLPFPHHNDGGIFENRPPAGSGRPPLPERPYGYYHEYVHPTPGIRGPGAQRIVTGKCGEVYYTRDHYKTFERLK